MSTGRQRRDYDRAVTLHNKVLLANGRPAIEQAQVRLCGACHFECTSIPGTCGVNNLLLPLTTDGKDCSYYLTKRTRMPISLGP